MQISISISIYEIYIYQYVSSGQKYVHLHQQYKILSPKIYKPF